MELVRQDKSFINPIISLVKYSGSFENQYGVKIVDVCTKDAVAYTISSKYMSSRMNATCAWYIRIAEKPLQDCKQFPLLENLSVDIGSLGDICIFQFVLFCTIPKVLT